MKVKIPFILILALFLLSACNASKQASKAVGVETKVTAETDPYKLEAMEFQTKLNEDYLGEEESPLSDLQKKILQRNGGHNFFDINPDLRFLADFDTNVEHKTIEFKTTTERLAIYDLYGIATFSIDSKTYKVNIYQSHRLRVMEEYKDHLFFPFTDLSNGETSYGGGRFIDLTIPEADQIVIDFNQAYNPYCAYSTKYSCPIPPKANFIDYVINAGVRNFPELEKH